MNRSEGRYGRPVCDVQKLLAAGNNLTQIALPFPSGHASVTFMKAKIVITPKKAVLDPQGKTVQTALEHMGYAGVAGVHVGKYIEIDLVPGTDKTAAAAALNEAAHKFLSNPVIEDYLLEIVD